MNAPNGSVASPHAADADAKPRRKALIRSLAGAEVQKRILENKISYLEKCIAAAKGLDAKPVEKKRESNAEIVERLMKLPTENERWTALNRLDEKTQMSLTMGEMKRGILPGAWRRNGSGHPAERRRHVSRRRGRHLHDNPANRQSLASHIHCALRILHRKETSMPVNLDNVQFNLFLQFALRQTNDKAIACDSVTLTAVRGVPRSRPT